jgi:hypothetical protein
LLIQIHFKTFKNKIMIEKLIAKSRTTEVDAASIRIIGAYKKHDLSSDAHLTGIFTALETESARLTAAVKRAKTESVLEEKDEVRDNKMRAIHYLLMGLLHHPDATIKTSAEKVEDVFDNYGLSILSESYASESSLIVSLLGDLAKQNLQASIAALSGCAELIAELQTAQTDFEQTRIAFDEEKAKEGTLENATAIKKEVLLIINDKLVVYLRAMIQVDEATYGDFARTVAQIIADNNEMVKKRRKKPEPLT